MTSVILRCLCAAHATTPLYSYDGIMIRPTHEWVMFEPYKEFIVDEHICRAHDQPNCTWWNAMFLESMNTSLRHTNTNNVADKLFVGVPWTPTSRHLQTLRDTDEIPCIRTCLASNCSALTWFRQKNICAFTHDTVRIDESPRTIQNIRDQKIPMYRSYVVRGHGINKHDVRRFIEHLLDTLGCRLRKFRCAA